MTTKPTKTTKTAKTAKTAKVTKAAEPIPAPKMAETVAVTTPRPAKAPVPQAASAPRATFRLRRPGARSVAVAGSFNGWSAAAAALVGSPDGTWSIELALAPGSYEYRFVVDGEWIADPTATESVPNPFGGVNSLIRVTG